MFDSMWPYVGRQFPWYGDSLGKNTGLGYHTLLQGILPTQGSNLSLLHLLHCRQILYHWTTGEAHLFDTDNVYMEILISQFIPPSSSLPGSESLLNVCCVLSRFSHVWLFATLRTAAHLQVPLSMGFHSCLPNTSICTIFLDSTYIH